MRKKEIKNRLLFVSMIFLCMAFIGGCQKKEACNTERLQKGKDLTRTNVSENEKVVEGMLLTFGEDGMLFIDPETKSPFYVHIPEENIFDENGEKILLEDMGDGDLFAFYGDGIVLESYPPQYPAITEVMRIKDGNAEDAEQYKDILAQVYQEPDPSDIPYMDVEHRRKDAVVTVITQSLGYEWSYEAENGEKESIVACGMHVLDMKDTEPIRLDEETADIKLLFSKSPKSVKVRRWDKGTKAEDAGEGEEQKVALEKKEAIVQDAKKNSVYEVTAVWEQGTVTYGFVAE